MDPMEIEDFLQRRVLLEKQVRVIMDAILELYKNGKLKNEVWITIETLLSAALSLMHNYMETTEVPDEDKKHIINSFYYKMKEILKA